MSTPHTSSSDVVPAKSRTPDTYLILLFIAVLAYAATWFVTPGSFEVAEPPGGGREQVVPGTFTPAAGPEPAPLLWTKEEPGLASFLFEGLVSGDRNGATVGLMAFIFIIGGAFGVILKAGTMERALQAVMGKDSAKPGGNDLLPAGLFVAFSLGGAVFGMGEEAIVFTLIVAPALVRAGYDSITAVVCVYAATQVGFGASWMNPFSLVIAQGIAGLPILSGMEFRLVMWAVFTTIGAAWVWNYARKVRTDPQRSLAYASDARLRAEAANAPDNAKLAFGDMLILLTVTAGIAWVAWGVTTQGYYLPEIAAQFLVMGVVAGIIARVFKLNDLDGNDLVEAFREGATQMTPAVLVVAAAKGVMVLLGGDDPSQDSVLNAGLNEAAVITAALPDWAAAWGMYAVQSVLNVVIVSGSGQAALTMPLMAPLADLSGVSRQTAVLAFQLGDGVTNMVTPASAALMGCLAAARLDWVTWLKFIWRPMLGLVVLCSASVLIAHAIGYS